MAFAELKQRQSVIWGNGPYQNITETISDIHELVLVRLQPRPGVRWLDLACGTGAVAERAARAGANVSGIDLSPALVETARHRAHELGLDIDYRVGDCEDLDDVPDRAFEVVSSTCGIMFAPDHEATASELSRIVRPGGRIALANWEPGSGVAQLFELMAPFQPPPVPGAGSPFAWGDCDHVQELLGDDFDLVYERHVSTLTRPSSEDCWQLFSTSYGPTKTLAESLGPRREQLHRAWLDFFGATYGSGEEITYPREYVLVLGTRR